MKKAFSYSRELHCAVITGASSGIGAEFARLLGSRGVYLILSGRNEKALNDLRAEIGRDICTVISADLSDTKSCIDFFAKCRKYDPDILINNAGFGLYGEFTETSLSKELEMIDVNIKAVHILTKLYLADFEKRNSGYIMNVASIAGFLSGPLMSTYYATKGYVLKFSTAIYEELRRKNSNVHISVLCPGPVDTEFNNRAGVNFMISGHTGKYVADYALKKMFKKKLLIIPGGLIKTGAFLQRLVPTKLLLKICYMLQSCKK